ncbi:MAG: hypothetical protein HOF74_00645 [Gammaproteobacteria bacterium]|jgi:hypothetical protein|nr:hypothetical protein [Gammaproteobacteria bacterium]MBT3858313.1 hypothetical protein [Gammaproteobacteria bacterium]MBT3988564.1 hypothetical protein [Gammaproteobacteria bacterium]MBT4580498.1 hypothetical protein [Gammaproteobacteria bacterium]MBT4657768.1 hypothetical protein [Gammaproteobacteria bacterium]
MKQQVNLYLPEFKVKKDILTVVLMMQIFGGVIGLMILVSAFQFFSSWRSGAELEDLRAVLAEETQKTNELDGILARRSQNSELTSRLDAAESRLESDRQIRNFLSETQLGNVVGFSEYFKDLSRASLDGLSISEFRLSNGGRDVEVTGQVLDSALVPRFVGNLESGISSIKDKHFSPSITRTDVEEQYFTFQLSTVK